MTMILDNFHKPEKKAEAEAWARTNDQEAIGPNGIFSKEDLRVLWGSWGSFDLHASSSLYFTRETYERVQRVRRLADPDGTFTPNTFAVKRQSKSGHFMGTLTSAWEYLLRAKGT
jgi:hypothetical protein